MSSHGERSDEKKSNDTARPADGRTDGWMDGPTDGPTDGRTDGPTDGPTDGESSHGRIYLLID